MLDLAQTVVALLALFVSVYTIVRQRREMALSSKLNAAATLFNYYNSKISGLRNSIIRDSGDRGDAQLQPLETRKTRLRDLLKAHDKMCLDLERLYDQVSKNDHIRSEEDD
jgi:hypothetical protein